MQQDYDNGKYTVIFNERTRVMHALRNGEPWQDLCGNNLVYFMLVEHKQALERIAELEKDNLEQCRLNAMGSEREARLMARVKELEKDAARYRYAIENADFVFHREHRVRMTSGGHVIFTKMPSKYEVTAVIDAAMKD